MLLVGAWRSSVARLSGGQKVAGSNPVAPTIIIKLIYNKINTLQSFCKVFFAIYGIKYDNIN